MTSHAPARPKSDVLDCQWIRRLHSYGLLTASFRPSDEIVRWRGFVRQREMLIRYAAQHVQHLQKTLEEMHLIELLPSPVARTSNALATGIDTSGCDARCHRCSLRCYFDVTPQYRTEVESTAELHATPGS
jgi:hypothetical protein